MKEIQYKKRHLQFYQLSTLFLIVALLLVGCNPYESGSAEETQVIGKDGEVMQETATVGNIRIGVDETLRPIGRQMVNAYMNLHTEATIQIDYLPENLLFQRLLDDSVRLILAGRDLSPAEVSRIKRDKVTAKTTQLGTDAMVVVMHPDNPFDSLSRAQLQGMLKGSIRTWDQLDSSQTGEIVLVFDDANTGTLRLLTDLILPEGDTIQGKAYAAKGHEDLVDYVASNPQAMGFIGASWITDEDQPLVKEFREKVKMVRLEAPDTSDVPGQYVRPYQGDIALMRYPLCRPFYAHSREHFSGLGTGFVVFAVGEQGQRIVLKAGLNPQFPPPRYVIFPEADNEIEE